jgi:Protein of unknown function (DUF732)
VSRHRAQHRLTTQPTLRLPHVNPLWWLAPTAVVVSAGVLTAALQFTGPPPQAPQIAAQATTLPRPDPTTTEASRAFLKALSDHHVAVEPHQAVFVAGAVCDQRHRYNASLATLSVEVQRWAPGITRIDAATLVDDADRNLC